MPPLDKRNGTLYNVRHQPSDWLRAKRKQGIEQGLTSWRKLLRWPPSNKDCPDTGHGEIGRPWKSKLGVSPGGDGSDDYLVSGAAKRRMPPKLLGGEVPTIQDRRALGGRRVERAKRRPRARGRHRRGIVRRTRLGLMTSTSAQRRPATPIAKVCRILCAPRLRECQYVRSLLQSAGSKQSDDCR